MYYVYNNIHICTYNFLDAAPGCALTPHATPRRPVTT